MSLLLLIDGYNVAAPIHPGRNADPRWLEQNRSRLIRDLAQHLDESLRRQTCVVFDASNPPRDRATTYQQHGMEIRFAVGYPSADDLLEEIIRAHHTPKRLMVVSSDHRVQTAAQRRGAAHFDSEPWMDDLIDSVIHLAIQREDAGGLTEIRGGGEGQGSGKKPSVGDSEEVADWMREFGFED